MTGDEGPKPGDQAAATPAPRRTAKGETDRRELSEREQSSARRIAESKAVVPHMYLSAEATRDPDAGAPSDGAVLAAVGRALAEHRVLNSGYRDGGIEQHGRVNVGLVTAAPGGTLVPTLFDADKKSVSEIAQEIESVRDGAAAGSLSSPDLSGGTFTVTLLRSPIGPLHAAVTPGQAGHLGISATPGHPVALGLSCDGRAVRADQAAAFLERVAALVGGAPVSGT